MMWQSLWGFVQFFYPVLLLRWAFTHVAWLWVFGGGERCLGGGGHRRPKRPRSGCC